MTRGRQTLRARLRQPGHDLTWRRSEIRFAATTRLLLPARYTLEVKPRDLIEFYRPTPQALGLIPDVKLTDERTGHHLYIEVKRQGPVGNAEERAYKHHTSVFIEQLARETRLPYHAYATVFCESLATLDRYTAKIPAHIAQPHYLLWRDFDAGVLAAWLDQIRVELLDPSGGASPVTSMELLDELVDQQDAA